MQPVTTEKPVSMPKPVITSKAVTIRLAIGLLQGVVLYFLYLATTSKAWPATEPYLFAPLLLICIFMPVILMSSLGHITEKKIGYWILMVTVIIGAIGFYDIWRGGAGHVFAGSHNNGVQVYFPSALVSVLVAVGFYIAHALVLAGSLEQRFIARYPSYFEMAWKLAIQLTFSALFVGILHLVLWLGAVLFTLVKLNFLQYLLQKSWFIIPVTTFAFSCAMHLTDVRPAIVRGIRTLLLVLLSWILPIMTLMVVGFLLSLPWTGLSALWATGRATSVLLGTAAVLIILINAAFQNGDVGADVARIVRVSARVAALSLLPITVIAIYSLGLRVSDYGWTTDRIIAAACILVASCYALGYAWSACRQGGWLVSISSVNVMAAFIILAVVLALFSPIADPARLSVNNQMARFALGKVNAEKFDFDYLKFEGARYGLAALEQLKARTQGTDAALVRDKAQRALQKVNRWSPTPIDINSNKIRVWPKTAQLPRAFIQENWSQNKDSWKLPLCLTQKEQKCDIYLIDFNADDTSGTPKALVIGAERYSGASLMAEKADGHWVLEGNLPRDLAGCEPLREQLIAGSFRLVAAPPMKDLDVAGQLIKIDRNVSDIVSCSSP